MADYTIGGSGVIENSLNGAGIRCGQALQVTEALQLTSKGTTQPYPSPTSNSWKQGHTYWLADGAIENQNIQPLILAEIISGIKLGCFLWCNNGNKAHGTYPASDYSDWRIYFTLSDDDGIYAYDTGLSYSCQIDYNDQPLGFLNQDYCYIMALFTTGGDVYAHSCPWIRATYVLPWIPLKFEMIDLGAEYNNSRSYAKKMVYRDGTSLTADQIPKEADDSEAGGGDGDYDFSSDTISVPNLPTLGFANSGLGRLYTPTTEQLAQFSAWLYSDNILDTLAKMWSNPLDLVVSLGIVPVHPSHTGSSTKLKIGGIDTNVYMTPITNQYEELNFGSLNVTEYYGSGLDFSQTRLSIYLPYIGVRQLKTDEIMGGSVSVKYHIDLATGACIAFVTCVRSQLNSVLYQFEGNVFVQIPLIARDFSQVYQSIVRGVAETVTSGNPASAVGGAIDSAINVMGSKPNTSKSGGIGASGGLMSIRKPYLIIERPVQSKPRNYNKIYGIPSNITYTLNQLSGYTEVDDLIANTLTCTREEQDAIIARLKGGVII